MEENDAPKAGEGSASARGPVLSIFSAAPLRPLLQLLAPLVLTATHPQTAIQQELDTASGHYLTGLLLSLGYEYGRACFRCSVGFAGLDSRILLWGGLD